MKATLHAVPRLPWGLVSWGSSSKLHLWPESSCQIPRPEWCGSGRGKGLAALLEGGGRREDTLGVLDPFLQG